ncbi:MAG: OmpH family outer membrane protein [Verrucomicrobiota bacterium]|nr:OmpH family outer membrane protein [Verrucomicrobiota bacterium]
MKKSFLSLLALAVFSAFTLSGRAQPAPKILTVDIGKAFDSYYKKQDEEAKLRVQGKKAEDEMQRLVKEGNGLVDQYKELVDQSKNPAFTNEARTKADEDSKKKMEEIRQKQNELQTFRTNTQQELQQLMQNSRNIFIEEISRAAGEIARRKGATLLLDKSGVGVYGASFLVYSDPAYDITDEVIKEMNKDRPSPPPATTTAPAPTNEPPKITVPGLSPSK